MFKPDYEKKIKIGSSMVNRLEYEDFFKRYETITDTNKTELAKLHIRDLKNRGYKTKFKTVSFMDLLREICLTYKAIKLRDGALIQPYDKDIMADWLKW